MSEKQVVEYPLEEGGVILVEVDVPQSTGFERASRVSDIVKATQTFDQALERVKPAAQKIIAKLRSLTEPPDEIVVEFGIKLGAKAGALIASADAEANYTVHLTWRREQRGS